MSSEAKLAETTPGGVPHGKRLLSRLGDFESPIVQIWGWPGSGKRALLEAMIEAEAGRARALTGADVADPATLETCFRRPGAGDVRWFVCFHLPARTAGRAAELLRPGQRLLFGHRRRLTLEPLPVSVLPPAELLLTGTEMRNLWRDLSGTDPDPGGMASLLALTGGWYLPTRLVVEALVEGRLSRLDEDAVLALPSVDAFLRYEVLGALPEPLRQALAQVAAGASASVSVLSKLADEHALLPGAGGPLPAILPAFQARQAPQRPRPGSAPAAGGGFRISLFGTPKVTVTDPGGVEHEIRWPLRRALKILAFLASAPELEASRDELVQAAWPEEDDDRIEKNFHPTLSHLRRILLRAQAPGADVRKVPPLLFVNGVYRLNPELGWEVDVVEMTRASRDGRRLAEAGRADAALQRWERGWRLYRGPFLEGFYDAWAGERRERFRRLHLELLRNLGRLYREQGRLSEALDAYRALLIEDPLEERVHLAVMNIYAGQGRRDLVRHQYDRLTTLLAEELGVEPLPQTSDEYQRLMR